MAKTDPFIRMPQPDLLAQVGGGLKRVKAANEEPDPRGVRTIWHHGPMKTDLFSFVGADRALLRQELVFLGHAVSWEPREGLKTGTLDTLDSPSIPASVPIRYADGDAADPRIMLQASVVLKHCPEPDFYTQHLRAAVNTDLVTRGTPATDISELDETRQKELRRLFDISQEVATLPPPKDGARGGRSNVAMMLAIGALVGAAVGAALWWLV